MFLERRLEVVRNVRKASRSQTCFRRISKSQSCYLKGFLKTAMSLAERLEVRDLISRLSRRRPEVRDVITKAP